MNTPDELAREALIRRRREEQEQARNGELRDAMLARRMRQASYTYAVVISWLVGVASGVCLMGFVVPQ